MQKFTPILSYKSGWKKESLVQTFFFFEFCRHPKRFCDRSPHQAGTIHLLHEPFYEDMFVGTKVDGDIPTPQSTTARAADTLYGLHMDGRCGVALFLPSEFSNDAEPSTVQHPFDDLMCGKNHTIVLDYTKIKDREILPQTFAKLYPSFKNISSLRLLWDFISNFDTGSVKLHLKKAKTTVFSELSDRNFWLKSGLEGSHTVTTSTQHKQTLSTSKRLVIQKQGRLSETSFKNIVNIAERSRLLSVHMYAKHSCFSKLKLYNDMTVFSPGL